MAFSAIVVLVSLTLPALPLRVEGRKLLQGSHEVRLQGVNVPSLEWSNEGENVLRSVIEAFTNWGVNTIRLPLSQDRWFGKAPGQDDEGESYRLLVDKVIEEAARRRGWVILDLHWSNGGVWGRHMQQHPMPDMGSAAFWRDAARRYRSSPTVLFDLYNEPRDVTWKVWRDGGQVTTRTSEGTELTYHSPGMQGLLDAVRAVGAKNAVVAGGLDWAYDLRGILEGHELKDRYGNGVIYASHVYPWKRDWEGQVGKAADRHPVLIGEVGCEPDPAQEDPLTWGPKVMDWIDARQLHWTAWCFHPSASPRMLADWSYKPTSYWGELAKKRLLLSDRVVRG